MRARLQEAAGASLVEVLVTVAIMGSAFAVILGGVASSSMISDYHRKQAVSQAVIRTSAEAVKRAVYVPCAAPAVYAPSVVAPSGYTATITAVRYWDGAAWTAACTVDPGLQRVDLQVASTDGRATESLEVVKRAP